MEQQDFEYIEKYITGDLSEEEQSAFKNKMKSDTSLQEQVEEQRILIEAIQEQSLRATLDRIHKNTEESMTVKNIPLYKKSFMRYAIAASVVVLFVIGGITLSRKQNTHQKLFASFFTPDPGLPTTMSTTSEYVFYEAMVDYKQGDYEKAILKWNPLLKDKPTNDTLNYFLGVAHLASDNGDEAISFLEKTTGTTESYFLSDAYYYLGLAYLKSGNITSSKEALSQSNLPKSKEVLSKISNE